MAVLSARPALTIAWVVLIACVMTACRTSGDEGMAPILLFNGTGTSAGDVAALEKIMRDERLDYSTADSARVNEMSETQFRQHRLLIVPGGNFVKIGNSLTSGAAANIRNAVQNGLNYLGICAGAFVAGNSPYNGLNLTSATRFGFYSAEVRGIRKAAVAITSAGGQTLDQYWEDGPQLTGWGAVVARYPDGTPAVVEGEFGNGWMILAGVHPEAPESWRRGMEFRTPVEADNAYATTLIRAAVNRESMPHY
jgi:glutamine amidotransferase-like uncharacterized protein